MPFFRHAIVSNQKIENIIKQPSSVSVVFPHSFYWDSANILSSMRQVKTNSFFNGKFCFSKQVEDTIHILLSSVI